VTTWIPKSAIKERIAPGAKGETSHW
jgi:hypothetical protein